MDKAQRPSLLYRSMWSHIISKSPKGTTEVPLDLPVDEGGNPPHRPSQTKQLVSPLFSIVGFHLRFFFKIKNAFNSNDYLQLYIKLGTNTAQTNQQKTEDVISFHGTIKEEYLVYGKR